MKKLTVAQVCRAASQGRYMILTYACGTKAGVNCKAVPLARKRATSHMTNIVSFAYCDIHDYITHKTPFI